MDKKEMAKKQAEFQLHVLLVMRQQNVSKSVATFTAWLEGEDGVSIRLKNEGAVK